MNQEPRMTYVVPGVSDGAGREYRDGERDKWRLMYRFAFVLMTTL